MERVVKEIAEELLINQFKDNYEKLVKLKTWAFPLQSSIRNENSILGGKNNAIRLLLEGVAERSRVAKAAIV